MLSWFSRRSSIPTKNNLAFGMDLLEARWFLTAAANTAPVLDAIANVKAPAGKPYILPFTASDANGDALRYSITTSGNVDVKLHKNNPYLNLVIDEEVPAVPAIPAHGDVLE